MSAFDDEFGLFSDEDQSERQSTLGARKIASDDTFTDEFELEDAKPVRPAVRERRKIESRPRKAPDPAVSQQRAAELLSFLAKKLVTKPEVVTIENFPAENGEPPLIEMAVDPEDLGKVIGRSGRVAQALRTIARATNEGRLSVEIFDTDEFYADEEEDGESSNELE